MRMSRRTWNGDFQTSDFLKTINGETMVDRAEVYLIKQYQKHISPGLGNYCKYYPTCSQYAIDAIEEYGAVKGTAMGIARIARCNPFSKGGYDPVKPSR